VTSISNIPITASNGLASLGVGTGTNVGVLGSACTGAADHDRIFAVSRCAIATVVRWVFALGRSGITDASHTRSLS
jgi:hypothetical protein